MDTLFGATDYVVKGSFAGILHLQLGNVQDKKGKPTEKKEIQAGIIIFRPATKETKGKKKFIVEFENFPEAEEDEETQLEILGKETCQNFVILRNIYSVLVGYLIPVFADKFIRTFFCLFFFLGFTQFSLWQI
uniref:Uncharacterized protein n=1 Tax=Meloidogyne enterolobii TaxID=390850 RepID=A0A6V7Y3U0_MELEN|nr:unnamed protein product [Meloidogyne enterolobii]